MPIELQQFRQNLTYDVKAPLTIISTDLNDLEALSQLAELRKNKHAKKAIYYFVGAAVLGVVSLIVSSLSILSLLLKLGCIGLGIAWVYSLVMMSKFGKLNILNYRYNVTKQILDMLVRDLDEISDVYLKLSFQNDEINENKINTIAHPHRTGWKIDIYQNQWLNIQGIFLDKTRFKLTTMGLTKKQYGWKRGRSGKSKYKSKVKSVGLDINLSLTYPQRRYGAVKILKNEIRDAIKLPQVAVIRNLKITDKAMHLMVRIPPNRSKIQEDIYQTIVAMFLSLYQILNLAKMLSKEKV
ncbi:MULTISPECIES: hypothetical protein [unclassified Anabaena]|uniref:hypothetical protein n=1 Tax=unclassified Anabaena TaxID=2619674 RepID=UPI0039C5B149